MNTRGRVIDTSALIAYLAGEEEADEVGRLLVNCEIPFICLSELYYLVWRKKGRAEADKAYGIVRGWGLPLLYPNEQVVLNAGRIKAVYKLGISDSYIAALALERGAPLLTKDKDYAALRDEIEILLL